MKLTKAQTKLHQEAMSLVNLDRPLTDDERDFVFQNYHEGSRHNVTASGAFFTPLDLAMDLTLEIPSNAWIIDLCAGIGILSYAASAVCDPERVICVESDQEYCRIGKRLQPNACWIQSNVFDFQSIALPGYSRDNAVVLSNPPFGALPKLNYDGPNLPFHHSVIQHAAFLADFGVFILPTTETGYRRNSLKQYSRDDSASYYRFAASTGLDLRLSCLDASYYANDWRHKVPSVEVVTCELAAARSRQSGFARQIAA